MSTAQQLAHSIGVDCDSCIEECLMNMQIHTGPSTEIPMYRRKEFMQKLDDQFWVHNAVVSRQMGIS